jgi:uncharacterized protein (DUF1800 family)
MTKIAAFLRPGSLLLAVLVAASPPKAALASASTPIGDDARIVIVHVLNRLGYGPSPEELEHVRAIGVETWIDQQLHPEKLSDSKLEARLALFPTLALDTRRLMQGYEIPPEAKKEIQKRKAEMGANPSEADEKSARRELMAKYQDRMDGTPRQVLDELQAAKLIRATYSERQLQEVLTDFWMNHFNVYAQKGQVRFLVGEYERDVIRPRVLGKFEDLLKATAESPAMLFYLDNWLSAGPDAPQTQPGQARRGRLGGRRFAGDMDTMRRPTGTASAGNGQGQGRRRGLNENYAREIMELHTLGVEGGYTQQDVTQVARCFTGWTIRGLKQQNPEFSFEARLHEPGDKLVLGQKIGSSGKDEGDKVIHLLATSPATARFIAYKLCRRFVADEPPQALVERAAETFRKTDGDLRAVVTTIVGSPEFFAPENRDAKVKTPFEFVASALRASGADVKEATELNRRLGEMGMPLYMQQPPTGYKDTADAWVSTSGLLARLNFALDLAKGSLLGVRVDVAAWLPNGSPDVPGALAQHLVPRGLSDSTRATLSQAGGPALEPTRVAGLILGSPEFQRR